MITKILWFPTSLDSSLPCGCQATVVPKSRFTPLDKTGLLIMSCRAETAMRGANEYVSIERRSSMLNW